MVGFFVWARRREDWVRVLVSVDVGIGRSSRLDGCRRMMVRGRAVLSIVCVSVVGGYLYEGLRFVQGDDVVDLDSGINVMFMVSFASSPSHVSSEFSSVNPYIDSFIYPFEALSICFQSPF